VQGTIKEERNGMTKEKIDEFRAFLEKEILLNRQGCEAEYVLAAFVKSAKHKVAMLQAQKIHLMFNSIFGGPDDEV